MTQAGYLEELLTKVIINEVQFGDGMKAIEEGRFESFLLRVLGQRAVDEWCGFKEVMLNRMRISFWQYFETRESGPINQEDLIDQIV